MNYIPPSRTNEESADLLKRIDTFISKSDISQISNIQKYQTDHTLYMGEKYRRFMNQFEMYFCVMTTYSHNINYLAKRNWPINRGFQFVVATRSLKQFYSAYILLNSGFYEDSITILRSVYESFLRILFISCYPDNTVNIYPAPGQSGPKFNATDFVKYQLKLDWETYPVMSAFAHSNSYIVMQDMIDIGIEKQAKLIALEYEKSDDMIGATTNLIMFLQVAYLRMYDELFVVDISEHDQRASLQPHIDKLHEYSLVANESLRGHTEAEYWRNVGADLNRLFELVKTMDANPKLEWRKVWESI